MLKAKIAVLVLCALALLLPASAARAEGTKQPFFLLCPHNKKYDAWSLCFNVDPADHSRVLSLGLEKLPGVNSVDLGPDGYEHSLKAQRDPKTPAENLGTLPVAEFGQRELRIEKDDALHVGISPAGQGTYRLTVSMRATSDQRFNINGKEKDRDIVVKYDAATKNWGAYAEKLLDGEGRTLTQSGPLAITGVNFPVTGTGIYRIVAVFADGEPAIIVDGWKRH